MYKLVNQSDYLLNTFGIPDNESIEWFANQVLFGIGGEKSDVVIPTKRENIRCRAVVIELKKGYINQESYDQIKKYVYWIYYQSIHYNTYFNWP